MRIDELLPVAFESLFLNKVRTGLTMLGIVIGVMSVITMIGIGQASQAQITSQVQGMGTTSIVIQSGSPKIQGFGRGQSAQTLTLADAKALDNLTGIVDVASMNVTGTVVKLGKAAVGATAIGATGSVQAVRGLKLTHGRFFLEQEAETAARVAVIGAKLARELFPAGYEAAIGAKVLVGKRRYRVIGVLEEQQGFGGAGGQEIYLPIRAYQAAFKGGDKVGSMVVKAESEAAIPGLQAAIIQTLRQRHGLAQADDDDFRLQTQAELLQTVSSITSIFTGLLAGIAGISLLVGGIGIMNIMLVSVTERTREIGVRKAVGAKRRHIMLQFLVESGALSLAGGMVGIALGLGLTAIATRAIGIPFVFSGGAVAGAFGFSAAVGVFFGAYPAYQASLLDPVDALRYE